MQIESLVTDEDFLWRNDPSQSIKNFELNTARFGTSAAPFLATRSLHQLANDELASFPRDAAIVKNDFYVHAMLTDASTREEAELIRDELIGIIHKGDLNLRKWTSNDSNLVNTFTVTVFELYQKDGQKL